MGAKAGEGQGAAAGGGEETLVCAGAGTAGGRVAGVLATMGVGSAPQRGPEASETEDAAAVLAGADAKGAEDGDAEGGDTGGAGVRD